MRNRVVFVALILGLAMPASVLAAKPVHESLTFNDPADDAAESAAITAFCGFPVEADISGRIGITVFDRDGAPGVFELDVYGLRVTYRNPATGTTIKLGDVGPDRFYIQDGVGYVAVTGRSETGVGNIGVIKIDLATGEVVHSAGNDTGFFFDHLCDDLS